MKWEHGRVFAPFVGESTGNALHFQEGMEERRSAPTVARERRLTGWGFLLPSRRKSLTRFTGIRGMKVCNIHKNPAVSLVHTGIPICVKVR